MNKLEEKPLQTTSFVVHATRGLIREQGVRRKLMMAIVILALAMMAAGSTFLQGYFDPKAHVVAFIVFWGACAWLTMLALLLALFDLLLVRAQARAARRVLKEQAFVQPVIQADEGAATAGSQLP